MSKRDVYFGDYWYCGNRIGNLLEHHKSLKLLLFGIGNGYK